MRPLDEPFFDEVVLVSVDTVAEPLAAAEDVAAILGDSQGLVLVSEVPSPVARSVVSSSSSSGRISFLRRSFTSRDTLRMSGDKC